MSHLTIGAVTLKATEPLMSFLLFGASVAQTGSSLVEILGWRDREKKLLLAPGLCPNNTVFLVRVLETENVLRSGPHRLNIGLS